MLRGLNWAVQYFISLLRVFFLLVAALFLPQLCLWHANKVQEPIVHSQTTKFKLGLENLSDKLFRSLVDKKLASPLIGLITNQTGTDQEGNRNVDILTQKGLTVKKILVPQGTIFDDKSFDRGAVDKSDISLITLHAHDHRNWFNKTMLSDINVLMFDMQDSGIRYYGYVTLLLQAMEAAAIHNKKFIVLDRPNLLGWCMEGISSDAHIGDKLPVPLRHGMTVGELAQYFNKYVLTKSVDLTVVPMEHYDRQTEARKPLMCGLSGNITSIDSCYGYSFLGLLGEVAPFEIGVGTDKAFQCLLLPDSLKFPKQKWHELRVLLGSQGIESKLYRYYSDRKKEQCSGLRLYIHDINRFSSFKTLLTVLNFFKDAGLAMKLSAGFDTALGSHKVRSLLQGTLSPSALALEVNEDVQSFFKKAFSCFLYKPFPKMLQV